MKRFSLPLAILATLLLAVVSLFVGGYDIDLAGILAGGDEAEMFLISRVPRTIALILAACAMGVSGMVMQMISQNRFVEPTTTGTTQWAALGILLMVIIFPEAPLLARMAAASVFAFVGTMVFLAILRRVALKSSIIVPLIGIMLGAVVSAASTYIAASTNLLQMLTTWQAGSFTAIVRGRYEILWVVAAITLIAYIVADRLTAAGLGEEVSTNLGVNYNRVMLLGTALVALASGITTVVVGFLPFLGLVVPNLVSMARGDNLRGNIPWVCVASSALLIVCDIVGRTIRAPFEIPVSTILGVIGAAVFIVLILRGRRRVS